jgi:methyltransferase family protein
VEAPPDKPVRSGALESQQRAHRIALTPETWTRHEAQDMRSSYDTVATSWEADRGGYRWPPLADALTRGGPFQPGLAVEIATGTGLLTPLIAATWPTVVAVDLSFGMLQQSGHGQRIQADASRLPLADAIASAVVIGDGPLFAAEITRVMAQDATLVWSNALGKDAPFYLPTAILLDAMTSVSGRTWNAVESEAHWGSWVVLQPMTRTSL